MQTLDYSRPTIGAQAIGIAQGAFDFAARYMTEREQFGKTISEFQGLQFMLADMAMADRGCAPARVQGRVAGGCARPADDAVRLAGEVLASDAAMKVTTDAVQILGGYGYMQEYPSSANARRQDHADLRRNQPDPAGGHRQEHAEIHLGLNPAVQRLGAALIRRFRIWTSA